MRSCLPTIVILGAISAAVTLAGAGKGFDVEPLAPQSEAIQRLGRMVLVKGYKHTRSQGTDTVVGTISKDGGPQIGYDIGANAGNQAEHLAEVNPKAWSFTLPLRNGTTVTMDEAREELLVTMTDDYANFEASHVRTKRDVAEVLSMVFTYGGR